MANYQNDELHIYEKPGDATIQKSVSFSSILVLSEALEQTKKVRQH